MRQVHGFDEKTMLVLAWPGAYHPFMLATDNDFTRSLTLVLSESEWRALRDAEPDAVGWLQRQIRNRLSSEAPSSGPAAGEQPEYSVEDEY